MHRVEREPVRGKDRWAWGLAVRVVQGRWLLGWVVRDVLDRWELGWVVREVRDRWELGWVVQVVLGNGVMGQVRDPREVLGRDQHCQLHNLFLRATDFQDLMRNPSPVVHGTRDKTEVSLGVQTGSVSSIKCQDITEWTAREGLSLHATSAENLDTDRWIARVKVKM